MNKTTWLVTLSPEGTLISAQKQTSATHGSFIGRFVFTVEGDTKAEAVDAAKEKHRTGAKSDSCHGL